MNDDRKISSLTVGEFDQKVSKLVRDIPPEHFMKAVDVFFDKKVKQLGAELTGKDLTILSDRQCVRKTFDASHSHRIQKEKIKDTLLTEGIKKFSNIFFTVVALGLSSLAAYAALL